MDNYSNICFSGENKTYRNKMARSLNSLNEGNVIELLDFYFPNFNRGDVTEFIKCISKAKITIDELHYFAEKIKPHLQVILTMQDNELTQVQILDYSIIIFAGTDNTEIKTDDEIRMIMNSLINNGIDYSSGTRYSKRDEIGDYTMSPLYSIINYISTEEDNIENEPISYSLNDEEYHLGENNKSIYNDAF